MLTNCGICASVSGSGVHTAGINRRDNYTSGRLFPLHVFSVFLPPSFFQDMCTKVPDDPEHLAARRQWRDDCLKRLAKLKQTEQPQ